MNEAILIGISTIIGAFVGGLFPFLMNKEEKKRKSMESDIQLLANQIISYWNLEKLYSEKISNSVEKSTKTVLQEYRDKIEGMDLDRPTMTEKEAKKILIKNL